MRPFACAFVVLLLATPGRGAIAQETSCTKRDFEGVVNEAGSVLRDLNRKNTPMFQAKLRELKERRSWSNDEFLKEAEPFVRDARIVDYDQKSEQLLARISGGGQTSTATKQPDCALLSELRAALLDLLETQKEKWAYMMARINGALEK